MARKVEEGTISEAVPVMDVGEPVEKAGKKKPQSIEELPGVGEATAGKLKDAGYDTFEQLAVAMPVELAEVAGLGEGTAAKIINAARQVLEMGYETGDKILERRKLVAKISTGSKELDGLLGWGVETGAITAAVCRVRSSKAQLGFQLCVNVTAPIDN